MKNNQFFPVESQGWQYTHTHTQKIWQKLENEEGTHSNMGRICKSHAKLFFLQFDHKLEVCFIIVFLYILLQVYISFSLQMLHIQLNTIGGHFACTLPKRNLNHLNIFLVSRLQTQVIFERQYTVGACAFSSFSYHTSHTALVHYNSYNFS